MSETLLHEVGMLGIYFLDFALIRLCFDKRMNWLAIDLGNLKLKHLNFKEMSLNVGRYHVLLLLGNQIEHYYQLVKRLKVNGILPLFININVFK